MSAAAQVYHTPELMRLILERLDKRHFHKVLILEKSFFPMAIDVLWKEVPYQVTQNVINLRTPRGVMYTEAIRTITLHDPPFPRDETTQMVLITSLPDDFPNLRYAYRKSKNRPWAHEWELRVQSSGICEVDIRAELSVEFGADPSELHDDEGEEEELYPGFEVNRLLIVRWELPVRLRQHITITQDDEVIRMRNTWMRYLLDSKRRHPRICAIDCETFPLHLDDIRRLLEYRHDGHLPITELRAVVEPGPEVNAFERFCQEIGKTIGEELEVLQLDAVTYRGGTRLKLSSFDRVIQTVAQNLPSLRSLELPFTISDGGQFIRVTEIKVASHVDNILRNLRKVVVTIYSNTGFRPSHDARYPFPLEDVAQNLALLGAGSDCVYEIRNKSDVFLGMNISKALNHAVHEFQR